MTRPLHHQQLLGEEGPPREFGIQTGPALPQGLLHKGLVPSKSRVPKPAGGGQRGAPEEPPV